MSARKKGRCLYNFNYLYWNFLIENQQMLERNPRLSFAYKSLKNMSTEKTAKITADAEEFFKKLN